MQPEDEHTSNIHSGHNLNFMKISRERPCHELKEKILLNEKKETNYLGLSIHYGYTDINIFFIILRQKRYAAGGSYWSKTHR
jgi:hypothetical protein